MFEIHGKVQALIPYVEQIEVDAIDAVGEPNDGSIGYMRILRIKAMGTMLEITLMADDPEILEHL